MSAALDLIKIQAVIDELAGSAEQAIYGVFDPARIPRLQFREFDQLRNVRAAVSPDCSYRFVKGAIDAATRTLDLYIYNVSAQHLVDLLAAARDRGVTIRVMYDAMDTNGGERAKLAALGVALKEAPSTGRRKVFTVCHQKFAVIDGRILLIGSANWAGTSIPFVTIPGKFKKGNREWLLRIDDAAAGRWFQMLFDADWEIPDLEAPAGMTVAPPPPPAIELESPLAAFEPPDEVFDMSSAQLAVPARITPLLSPDNYFETVRDLIRNAQTSLDIEQQYIKLGGPKTRALLEALAVRKDEIEIRIIVSPAFREAWEQSVKSLDAVGLGDRLRAMNLSYYTHLHNKGVLVDRRIAVVSSTNWSENSIAMAREAGVVVRSDEIGGYFGNVIDFDWRVAFDPADVPNQLAALDEALEVLTASERERIHPADLR